MEAKPDTTDLIALFGEPIHTYTRAEALEDGVLVDVTDTAREAGFTVAVAITNVCYDTCVAWTEDDNHRKQTYQDEAGRLWDVLWMAYLAARRSSGGDRVRFGVVRVPRGGRGKDPRPVQLELHIGPGDDGEPVITIDLPYG